MTREEWEFRLKEAFPDATVEISKVGEIKIKTTSGEAYLAAAKKLKEMGFEHCSSVTAIDWKDRDRLELVAHVYTLRSKGPQVSIRLDLGRNEPEAPSLTSVWPTANWHEREAFDMFGIRFAGHPDLRRILLPENWQGGYPLLKDFVDKRPETPIVTRETYQRG